MEPILKSVRELRQANLRKCYGAAPPAQPTRMVIEESKVSL